MLCVNSAVYVSRARLGRRWPWQLLICQIVVPFHYALDGIPEVDHNPVRCFRGNTIPSIRTDSWASESTKPIVGRARNGVGVPLGFGRVMPRSAQRKFLRHPPSSHFTPAKSGRGLLIPHESRTNRSPPAGELVKRGLGLSVTPGRGVCVGSADSAAHTTGIPSVSVVPSGFERVLGCGWPH